MFLDIGKKRCKKGFSSCCFFTESLCLTCLTELKQKQSVIYFQIHCSSHVQNLVSIDYLQILLFFYFKRQKLTQVSLNIKEDIRSCLLPKCHQLIYGYKRIFGAAPRAKMDPWVLEVGYSICIVNILNQVQHLL